MTDVEIKFRDNQHRFYVGDLVTGSVEMRLPEDFPMSAVRLSFHCVGEVKWTEYHGTARYLDSYTFHDRHKYFVDDIKFSEAAVNVIPHKHKERCIIPFTFEIPRDKDLPSTMISKHGFVKYFIRVTIDKGIEGEKPKKFMRELIVLAPMERNLMIGVGGTVEKCVLLHGGTVSMYASIDRKGFAPGEQIPIHLIVNNPTNTVVVPRVSLHQLQIYMCGAGHKTIEVPLTEEPLLGVDIEPHTRDEQLLELHIPAAESFSIKSRLITVKYFVQVTLDIPHSFDLHVNLPVVFTSRKVVKRFAAALENGNGHGLESKSPILELISGH